MSPKEHHTEPLVAVSRTRSPLPLLKCPDYAAPWRSGARSPCSSCTTPPGGPACRRVGVFFSGLLLTGIVGTLLLVLLALFFAWLGYLAWPRLSSAERAMRCVVVAVLLGLGVLQSGIF